MILFRWLSNSSRACPGIERYVAITQPSPLADLTYEELISEAAPEPLDVLSIDETSVAELFYTSGSTGTPKGVMLTHRTLYLHAMSIAGLYQDVETYVDLHTIPLFHANGWGHPQASTMLGVKQVMVRRFEPNFVFSLIQRHRATDMSLVPTMANALLNCAEIGKYDISSMRHIMIGGAAASPELIDRMEKAFHCECIAGYGLTETAPVIHIRKAQRRKGIIRFRAHPPSGDGGVASSGRPRSRCRPANERCSARHAGHRRSNRDGRSHHGGIFSRTGSDRSRDDRSLVSYWRYGCVGRRELYSHCRSQKTRSLLAAEKTSLRSKWRRRSSRILKFSSVPWSPRRMKNGAKFRPLSWFANPVPISLRRCY